MRLFFWLTDSFQKRRFYLKRRLLITGSPSFNPAGQSACARPRLLSRNMVIDGEPVFVSIFVLYYLISHRLFQKIPINSSRCDLIKDASSKVKKRRVFSFEYIIRNHIRYLSKEPTKGANKWNQKRRLFLIRIFFSKTKDIF